MAQTGIPLGVLSDKLKEKINNRRVCSAVYTTYSFDPGFFELYLLPILFDYPFSQVERIRRVQLEENMRTIDNLAVYYDQTALAQDSTPAQLDYRRIDVHRKTGVFHPKVVLLLVEDQASGNLDNSRSQPRKSLSLIVSISSANLTRAGWWENVEVAHIEEIQDIDRDASRCSFRTDLLGLLKKIRDAALPDEDHGALDEIHKFLRNEVNRQRFEYDLLQQRQAMPEETDRNANRAYYQ